MSSNTGLDLTALEMTAKAILDAAGRILPAIPSMACTEPRYPSTAVIIKVPGRCQVSTYTCAVTSTWSIITALGFDIPLKEWFRRCHKAGCHPDDGMDIGQIRKALKHLKLRVSAKKYEGRIQIRKYIDASQPLLFGQGREMFDDGDHWMYVYGYSGRHVYVGNVVNPAFPISSKEAWSWAKFESELNPRELYVINV
jgi:hypothetical protein